MLLLAASLATFTLLIWYLLNWVPSESNVKLKPHLPTNCGSVIVHVFVCQLTSSGIVYQPSAPFQPEVDSYLRLNPAFTFADCRLRTAVIVIVSVVYDRKFGSTVKVWLPPGLQSRQRSPLIFTTLEVASGERWCKPSS